MRHASGQKEGGKSPPPGNRPKPRERQFFGHVRPLWGSKRWGIGRRAGRHAPPGAPGGKRVRTHRFLRSFASTGRPNPHKKAVSWGRNAWSKEESEILVRAPAHLAS